MNTHTEALMQTIIWTNEVHRRHLVYGEKVTKKNKWRASTGEHNSHRVAHANSKHPATHHMGPCHHTTPTETMCIYKISWLAVRRIFLFTYSLQLQFRFMCIYAVSFCFITIAVVRRWFLVFPSGIDADTSRGAESTEAPAQINNTHIASPQPPIGTVQGRWEGKKYVVLANHNSKQPSRHRHIEPESLCRVENDIICGEVAWFRVENCDFVAMAMPLRWHRQSSYMMVDAVYQTTNTHNHKPHENVNNTTISATHKIKYSILHIINSFRIANNNFEIRCMTSTHSHSWTRVRPVRPIAKSVWNANS